MAAARPPHGLRIRRPARLLLPVKLARMLPQRILAPLSRTRAVRTAGIAGLAVIGVAGLGCIAGCAKFNAALGQQWATVAFKPNTAAATVLQVRTACSHIPNVQAEALPRQRDPETLMYSVVYRTDNASDANLAQLQQCLQRYPSVAGVDFQDAGDEGG